MIISLASETSLLGRRGTTLVRYGVRERVRGPRQRRHGVMAHRHGAMAHGYGVMARQHGVMARQHGVVAHRTSRAERNLGETAMDRGGVAVLRSLLVRASRAARVMRRANPASVGFSSQ